jgi:hypothetical protein
MLSPDERGCVRLRGQFQTSIGLLRARVIRGRVARTLLYPNNGETAKGRAAQAASGERLVRWGREADTRDARQRAFRVFVFPRGHAYLS